MAEQNIDAKEIIRRFLVENGYDGLAGEDCGCGVDDLASCDQISCDCVPAYRAMCDGNPPVDIYGDPDHDCPGEPHDLFRPEKPEEKKS